jgi:capsular exopolysaccharide synthesis family protein
VSRVFDALRTTGSPAMPSIAASPVPFADLDESFRFESTLTATAQLGPESRLVFHVEPKGPGAERYRLMRHQLQAAHTQANINALLITSPGAGEGKSTVSLNVAASLAEKRNQRVLLLEGDLRRPSLERGLGLKLSSGLNQCFRDKAGIATAVWRIEPLGFYLLPAGKALDDPAELLTSEWFSEAVAKLKASFDWVIIDTPPAIPIVDALSLKRFADACILVAWAGRTQQAAITEAIRILGRNFVLGMILNGLEKLDRGYYEYYRYYSPKK